MYHIDARANGLRKDEALMCGRDTYRVALGHFATGVAVVSALDAAGEDIGLTINSFTSVSLDPPLVLWSLRRGSYYHQAFAICEYFAVSVLSEPRAEVRTAVSSIRIG